jgi:excisionase family DNA binding protein
MPLNDEDDLMTPREVAELFGVRTTTIARWAREGRLPSWLTPGGHRRYAKSAVRALLNADLPEQPEWEKDAVRLYEQGWSIRRVASEFGLGYSVMRRVLVRHVTLRK